MTSVPPVRTSEAEWSQDVAADHVEHDVRLPGVLQPVGLQVEERVRAQVEHGVPVGGAALADHPGSGFAGGLDGDRADSVGRAVDQDGPDGRRQGLARPGVRMERCVSGGARTR
ncbi:hypothetical protein G3I56_15590 [Streptomyces sp. SID12488]|nr:hypothetical protein [Streptomyces sp. SID12488]